ncbi:hypothetical protein C1752_10489 [Acaryochloris thomasi RCC1774]|uniref:Uncharacterized protein n=1 Tax=Acaryochloris thomasi RCC1774 TaxID=1764569 RepID=A0A2W1J898_9CYAN|nr:hypothetical protein C1752_10489 [Acaryochloris thomasi RCC1774]
MTATKSRAELLNLATLACRTYCDRRSYVEPWERYVPLSLHSLANQLSNCELTKNQVLPAVFSYESIELLRHYILNNFYFWSIVNNIVLLFTSAGSEQISKGQTLEAIHDYQESTTELFRTERMTVLDGTANPENLVMLTARGAILWDSGSNSWKINPLYFNDSELESIARSTMTLEADLS